MNAPGSRDAADRMVALAGWVLPHARGEWHTAMRAELAHLPSARERDAFARGCLRAVAPHLAAGLAVYLLIIAGVAALSRADGTRGPFTAMILGAGLVA